MSTPMDMFNSFPPELKQKIGKFVWGEQYGDSESLPRDSHLFQIRFAQLSLMGHYRWDPYLKPIYPFTTFKEILDFPCPLE